MHTYVLLHVYPWEILTIIKDELPTFCIISRHNRVDLLRFVYFALQVLAKNMTVLHKLAKVHLFQQYHYNFGLWTLKAVLVIAGELMRGSPELHEDMVLMKALRET